MIGGTTTLVTAAAALVAVLLLIAAGGRLARSGGWARPPRAGTLLALRESLALDTKRRLHIVQCGQRRVILLTGGSQDIVVGWIDEPP